MIWVFAEHRVDNRGTFVIAEQCLDRAEAFSAFLYWNTGEEMGMHAKLGGGTDRAAEQK